MTLHRLAKRRVIPKRVPKFLKMLLCIVYAFATAYSSDWETTARKIMGVRRITDVVPDDGIL